MGSESGTGAETTTEAKPAPKLADVIALRPPHRYTPEIVARMLMAMADDMRDIVIVMRGKNGNCRTLCTSDTGTPFIAWAGLALIKAATPK